MFCPHGRTLREQCWEQVFCSMGITHQHLIFYFFQSEFDIPRTVTRKDPRNLLQSCSEIEAGWDDLSRDLTAWMNSTCFCSVVKSCPTLCGLMDSSPPGSSVHGIFHTKILWVAIVWVAISFSRESSLPGNQTHVSCISYIGRRILYH